MNPTIKLMKQKMIAKPWLYEAEEHTLMEISESAVAFIQSVAASGPDTAASEWLLKHDCTP
jgi:hypothetical protein